MTHNEMTAALRGTDWPVFGPEDRREIADRLDRYRALLDRAIPFLVEDNPWQDEAQLLTDIEMAIK